jgi:hypothetical protein
MRLQRPVLLDQPHHWTIAFSLSITGLLNRQVDLELTETWSLTHLECSGSLDLDVSPTWGAHACETTGAYNLE